MLFRTLIMVVVVAGLGLGWALSAGPSLYVGYEIDNVTTAYEKAGVDVSECKNRRRTIMRPGGETGCLESSFRDIAGKMERPSFRVDEAASERSQDAPPVE
jgi:hypothetical protein